MTDSLTLVQGVYAALAGSTVIVAYLLGKESGRSAERARIVASKRNTDRTRRAT